MAETISFTLNGESVSVTTNGQRPLLWVLRTDLGLTGPKFGCGQSLCGACTVLIDNKAVRSCVYPVSNAEGREITTIEGLSTSGTNLHPIQEAFVEHGAIQCGYCTPGMILSAKYLLDRNPEPTELEIRQALSGNLCRCTGYNRIVKAVMAASKKIKKHETENRIQETELEFS